MIGARIERAGAVAAAVAALVVPWIAIAVDVEPLAVRTVVGLAAIAGGFHGLGTAVAALTSNLDARRELRLVWGMALYLCLAGIALACGALTAGAVRGIVIGGLVVHSVSVALSLRERVTTAATANAPAAATARTGWTWLVPAVVFIAVAALHALGAAGRAPASWFDDDGHVLAQLARLTQTGALGDPVGNALHHQLGGQHALGALAVLTGDLSTARVIDTGLALALVLALVWRLVERRDAHAVLWLTLIGLMVSSARISSPEPYALWTTVALVVGAYASLARPRLALAWVETRRLVPVMLLAGALVTVRLELAPAGIALVVAAGLGARRDGYRLRSAWLWYVVALAAVVVPYVIARALTHAAVPDEVGAVLARTSHAAVSPVRILGALAVIAVVVPLLGAVVVDRRPGRPFLAVVVTVAVGLAGLVAGLFGGGYPWRFVLGLALAYAIIVLVEIARGQPPRFVDAGPPRSTGAVAIPRAAYVVALAAVCASILGSRLGPHRWWLRYEIMFDDIAQLAAARATPGPPTREARLLADLPPDAAVGIWLSSPEQLDYRGRTVIDLRTRRLERVARRLYGPGFTADLERVAAGLHLDYLLIEEDNLHHRRARDLFLLRHLCPARPDDPSLDPYAGQPVICLDALETVAAAHPTVVRAEGLRVVDLRRGR